MGTNDFQIEIVGRDKLDKDAVKVMDKFSINVEWDDSNGASRPDDFDEKIADVLGEFGEEVVAWFSEEFPDRELSLEMKKVV